MPRSSAKASLWGSLFSECFLSATVVIIQCRLYLLNGHFITMSCLHVLSCNFHLNNIYRQMLFNCICICSIENLDNEHVQQHKYMCCCILLCPVIESCLCTLEWQKLDTLAACSVLCLDTYLTRHAGLFDERHVNCWIKDLCSCSEGFPSNPSNTYNYMHPAFKDIPWL